MAEESANRSIRAPASVWEAVKAEAEGRGMNVNSWVCMVMTDALGSGEGARFQGETSARPSVGKALPAAARTAVVKEAVRSAEAKSVAAEAGPTFGYVRPAPGARLKRR